MHKHIGNQLENLEVGSHEEVKSQQFVKHVSTGGILTQNKGKQESHHVHYQQVLCNYRYIAHLYYLFKHFINVGYYYILAAKLLKISVIMP